LELSGFSKAVLTRLGALLEQIRFGPRQDEFAVVAEGVKLDGFGDCAGSRC
jgi:hypothetical protein